MDNKTLVLGTAIVVGTATYYAYQNNFNPEEIKKNLIYDYERFTDLVMEVISLGYDKLVLIYDEIKSMIIDLIDLAKKETNIKDIVR